MPTYDFECPDCGHNFEHMQSISAPPLRKCPRCGKRRLRRLIGMGSGLIFKGAGFYLTDYARKDSPAADKPKTDPAPEPAKAEAKPEAKKDSTAPVKKKGKA
jgi:putative FmdB family regulatory protein